MSSIEKAIQQKAAIAARDALPAPNAPAPAPVRNDPPQVHPEPAPVQIAPAPPQNPAVPSKIEALWHRFEEANNALPPDLRLRRESVKAFNVVEDLPPVHFWLYAKSGAALTCMGDGIRYVWRKQDYHKGNSFWIRWKADKGYVVNQRVRAGWSASYTEERRFKASAVDYMLKCLAKGVRIKPKSVCVRKFWFF